MIISVFSFFQNFIFQPAQFYSYCFPVKFPTLPATSGCTQRNGGILFDMKTWIRELLGNLKLEKWKVVQLFDLKFRIHIYINLDFLDILQRELDTASSDVF